MTCLCNSDSDNLECVKVMKNKLTYSAKAVLLTRDSDGNWEETIKTISSKNDFLVLFGDGLTQVNLSKYFKLYYDSNNFENGVMARCIDMDDEVYFLSGKLLFVLCDDEKPIDITSEAFESMKKIVTLY